MSKQNKTEKWAFAACYKLLFLFALSIIQIWPYCSQLVYAPYILVHTCYWKDKLMWKTPSLILLLVCALLFFTLCLLSPLSFNYLLSFPWLWLIKIIKLFYCNWIRSILGARLEMKKFLYSSQFTPYSSAQLLLPTQVICVHHARVNVCRNDTGCEDIRLECAKQSRHDYCRDKSDS